MSDSKQIPAFSIMEAVVGMVVMAIVMGIVFIIFSIVSERMLDFKNQNQYIADMNRLTYSINKDIFESEKLIEEDNGFLFYDYTGNKVVYKIQDDYLLREKVDFIDTFRIPVRHLKIDTIGRKSRKIVFQRIEMEVDVNKLPLRVRFFKKIEANELLKTLLK